jgi:pimeloyl-ACP methyl ester carboxylesterase
MSSIVLVHGLPDHSGVWEKLIPHLSGSSADISLISLPGITDEKVLDENCFFEDIMDQLVSKLPNQKSIYIGHDFGAILGTMIAQHRPDLISKLVLINGVTPDILISGIKTDNDQSARTQYANKISGAPEQVLSKNDYAFIKAFLFKDENSISEVYRNSIIKNWGNSQVLRNMGTYYRSILNSNHSKYLFNQATLQIWSPEDPFLGPFIQQQMKNRFPNHVFENLETLSHWPQLSMPELVATSILKFLELK